MTGDELQSMREQLPEYVASADPVSNAGYDLLLREYFKNETKNEP